MLEYREIEALQSVVKHQSFEKAALELHITQSAVSQRIKSLEVYHGEPVLIRALPYRTTDLGDQLIRLLAQIQLLEKGFVSERSQNFVKPKISIAINRDSLETWFLDAVYELMLDQISLEIIGDDQELTLDYFKRGVVSACLSTGSKTIQNAESVYLGSMTYIMVASPKFLERYGFKDDLSKFFRDAPALKFDRNDHLHGHYLKKNFSEQCDSYQIIPSVTGFKKYAMLGVGYGLIPQIDIADELKNKKLVNLFPKNTLDIPLYWHMWSIRSEFYQKINCQIIECAKKRLKGPTQ